MKIILFFASITAYYYVDAAFAVYSTEGCDNCLDNGYVTCRSKHNNSISYCCDPTEPTVKNCTSLPENPNSKNYDICNTEIVPSMQSLACPFLHKTCSNSFKANSSKIHVTPQRLEPTIIDGSFSKVRDEECYY